MVAREDIKPGALLYRNADAGNALQGDQALTRDVDFIVGLRQQLLRELMRPRLRGNEISQQGGVSGIAESA